ncbi:uncharacterized protein LOC110862281 isoform X2 [Folsomia candida]|uniref:uncharacterized protein LOC110862281 isoform X2 n=1 Tax=Folsomia candida TaxID=158441 RepID=UPI001605306F|nr:uncharacterized protein LOC110862281 isoform X2 [Folsomia candida]
MTEFFTKTIKLFVRLTFLPITIFCGIVVATLWILCKDLIQANPSQPDEMSKTVCCIILAGAVFSVYARHKILNRSQELPTVKYGCGSDGGLFTPGSRGVYIAENNPAQVDV